MEGEADRDDLRFRLDWPEADLPTSKSEDVLTDFSFEWDEQPVELTLAQTAEPQASDFEAAVEPELDVEEPPATEFAPTPEVVDFAPVPDVVEDPPLYDDFDTLETVRRVLNEHNDALVQLSEAVAQLASNVRVLVEQNSEPAPVDEASGAGVTASAMLTLSAEMSGAIEPLTERFDASRADLQGLMDDVVAAAANPSAGNDLTRMTVELERVRSEVQALKRRLPVRARELDAADIADKVTEAVLAALAESAPLLEAKPIRATRPRAATPVKAAPEKARPVRRRVAAPESEPPDSADYPVATAKRATRQRPLRAD
jgi:hypothetical protein